MLSPEKEVPLAPPPTPATPSGTNTPSGTTSAPLASPTLKSRFLSILSPITPTFSSPSTTPPISKQEQAAAFFPPPTPARDGPNCLQDCNSCTLSYPRGFKIEQETDLFDNGVKAWDVHVLVATGRTNWKHDVADEGGVLGAVSGIELKGGVKIKVSAANMPVVDGHGHDDHHGNEGGGGGTRVLVLPAMRYVDKVTEGNVRGFVREFVEGGVKSTTPVSGGEGLATQTGVATETTAAATESGGVEAVVDEKQEESGEQKDDTKIEEELLTKEMEKHDMSTPIMSYLSRPCTHRAVILLCSHRTRDARCGQSAPLLKKEFERHLRTMGLYRDWDDERPRGVGVYLVSHVGGHKWSGNVIIYRRRSGVPGETDGNGQAGVDENGGLAEKVTEETTASKHSVWEEEGATQCIWLGRVTPQDCEGIVKYTVLKGKVVKPERQLRGGFDRVRELVSW